MREMYAGFWGWDFSQQVFGALYLLTLFGCIAALGVCLYFVS